MTINAPAQQGGSRLSDTQREAVDHLLAATERRLHDFLSAEAVIWARISPRARAPIDAIAALVQACGKRLRPAFCIAGYLAGEGGPEGYDGVVSAVVALEVLHACALIHDDVMDQSDQRRGEPTAHVRFRDEHRERGWQGEAERYGENVAILAGDLALVYSDRIMAEAPATVRDIWCELRAELIIGQYMDVLAAAEFSADPQLARWTAVAKSGHYTIHRPLAVGARLAGRPDLAAPFQEYGVTVGEAFQLRDDLIDAFGESEVTGKPAGLDFERHKMTLLLGLAMERDTRVRYLFLDDEHGPEQLRRALVESQVRTDIEDHIGHLVQKGCGALAEAALDDAWREQLGAMAHMVAFRDR
ncbi:polyprenyl synthetase family protein [Streptomyces kasugaensis]|uniref:Polyprenyl synthetase family protein n=1 Tax=Streptomyces kasugaensis TaxID=1946 RepID=A0A4Q9HSN2_STRKA|nr:polyprenyl synthetase family protein [Streptomyces kasugaensis]TBO57479.1 polyprenyl synthetase family protein [Streptomyces kasugaensis]